MRIVGGELRGRRLLSPKGDQTRPTTDRNRESLFNILTHQYRAQMQGHVLDLFAGTGALGLEALSRGAAQCLFIEKARHAADLITQHIDMFDLASRARLMRMDATQPGNPPDKFDLVLADPPYGRKLGERAAVALNKKGWLADDAIFVLEEDGASLPEAIDGFRRLDVRRFGNSAIGFYQNVTS